MNPRQTNPHDTAPVSSLPRRRALQVLAGLGLLGAGLARAEALDPVTLEFARAEHEAGRVTLIDIREPEEHARGVAAGVKLLPMRQLGQRLDEIPTDPKKPVLLICNSQNRSSAVVKALRERGHDNIRYVNGGMSEWARRGWPMVSPGS